MCRRARTEDKAQPAGSLRTERGGPPVRVFGRAGGLLERPVGRSLPLQRVVQVTELHPDLGVARLPRGDLLAGRQRVARAVKAKQRVPLPLGGGGGPRVAPAAPTQEAAAAEVPTQEAAAAEVPTQEAAPAEVPTQEAAPAEVTNQEPAPQEAPAAPTPTAQPAPDQTGARHTAHVARPAWQAARPAAGTAAAA